MAAKKTRSQKIAAAKPAKSKPRADRWRLLATYVGDRQFRRGERVSLGVISKGGVKAECFGPSQRKPGKTTVQWVKAEELADFSMEWCSTGCKRAYYEAGVQALLQAAELMNKSKK